MLGAIIAAAFIGPGTVTTASVIGAEYAYVLVWTIVFSVLTTSLDYALCQNNL